MTVSVNVVARRYTDVIADQVIAVDYPAYETSDILVLYGNAVLTAVENTDYTVTLGGDFQTFTVTVLAPLVAKIDALIAADATEVNAITVRRELDYLTDATPAGVRRTDFTSRELERVTLRDQQLHDQDERSVRLAKTFAAPYPNVEINTIPADLSSEPALVFKQGGGVGAGPTTLDLQNAGANAAVATTKAAEAAASAASAAADAALLTPFSVVAISANETIAEARRNKLLRTDQRRFFTLPVPTALGNGFAFTVDGGGANFDPAIGTTISVIGDDRTFTSVEVAPGQVAEVFTDGTDWFVYFTNRSHKKVVFIDPIGVDVPFVDVDVPYGVTGFSYRFHSFIPQIDTGYLAIQVGNSGGLEVGASSYYTMSHGFASGTGTGTLAGGFIISEQGVVPNTAGQEGWGSGRMDRFYSSLPPVFEGRRAGVSAGATNTSGTLYGRMAGVVPSAADRIRVLCNNGFINGLNMTFEWDV